MASTTIALTSSSSSVAGIAKVGSTCGKEPDTQLGSLVSSAPGPAGQFLGVPCKAAFRGYTRVTSPVCPLFWTSCYLTKEPLPDTG